MAGYIPLTSSADLAQIQSEDEKQRRRQQMAQQFQQAGFNPVQGGNGLLSLLAAAASTLRGNYDMKDADGKLSENLAKRFDVEQRQAQAQAEAAAAKEEKAYQRDLQKIDYTNQSNAKFREPSKIDPLSADGQAATLAIERAKLGMQPKTGPGPSESDRKIAQLRQLGASDDQIRSMLLGNQGGGNAPSGYRQTASGNLEKIPGGPADTGQEADPRQSVADDALRFVAAITGKPLADVQKLKPDAVAKLVRDSSQTLSGPILGNAPYAGVNTEAILKQMAAKQARLNNPKGQVTDADFRAAERGLPAIDRTPSANAEIIASMLSGLGQQQAPQAQQQPQGMPQQAPQGQPTATATGPNGQKIGLVNGQWVPL